VATHISTQGGKRTAWTAPGKPPHGELYISLHLVAGDSGSEEPCLRTFARGRCVFEHLGVVVEEYEEGASLAC
jgi:hypothetical protein